MAKKKIKAVLTFTNDHRKDGLRLAEIKTDSISIQNAIISCMPLIEDNPCKVKIKNTKRYILKHKTLSFIRRTGYVLKAIKTACSSDFYSKRYAEDHST